jgi:multidrug resistance efflux pump
VKVVPEVSGRVETVLAREGQKLEVGQPIAKLETSALESELAHTREEMAAAVAEVRKYSGLNDPANEQIALTKVRSAEEKIKRLDRDIAAATLRSPIAGVLLTKDIELLRGVYLNAGADFAVVGQTDQWDLLVHINEKEIGKVERLYREKGPVDVRFILYTHNQNELLGKFKDRSQLSQIAYPHERENALKENAFILTLPNIEAPDNIRRSFRPDLTGRSSIQLGRRPVIFIWGRNIAQWVRLKWVW